MTKLWNVMTRFNYSADVRSAKRMSIAWRLYGELPSVLWSVITARRAPRPAVGLVARRQEVSRSTIWCDRGGGCPCGHETEVRMATMSVTSACSCR